MDYTVSAFYSVRLRLLLMNPFEMIFLIGAPALILWNAFRHNKRSKLWLWGIFTFAGWPLFFAGVFFQFQLVMWWMNRVSEPPAALVHMLDGDGPKMIVAAALGGVYAAIYFLLWLVILSPMAYLTGRERKAEPVFERDSSTRAARVSNTLK